MGQIFVAFSEYLNFTCMAYGIGIRYEFPLQLRLSEAVGINLMLEFVQEGRARLDLRVMAYIM